MVESRFFKNAKIADRASYLHPTAYKILEEMVEWCLKRAISPVVTETVTTLDEDKALCRVSTTHCEGRAFDIRSAGWDSKNIEDFRKYFDGKYGFLGALSSTGKPSLIVHHDAGTGLHFHVQLGRGFAVLGVPARGTPSVKTTG